MKAFVIYIGVLLFNFCSLQSAAQKITSLIPQNAKDLSSFIPKGWMKIDQVSGDFNDDGKKDIALVLIDAHKEEHVTYAHRSLIILKGTANGFVLSSGGDSIVLCHNCGGMHGEPYNGMSFKGNILSISHYGGTMRRWSFTEKFQFRQGKWVLIGTTVKNWWLMIREKYRHNDKSTYFKDINYMTGEYIEKEIDDSGKKLKDIKGKQRVEKLTRLENYRV